MARRQCQFQFRKLIDVERFILLAGALLAVGRRKITILQDVHAAVARHRHGHCLQFLDGLKGQWHS